MRELARKVQKQYFYGNEVILVVWKIISRYALSLRDSTQALYVWSPGRFEIYTLTCKRVKQGSMKIIQKVYNKQKPYINLYVVHKKYYLKHIKPYYETFPSMFV